MARVAVVFTGGTISMVDDPSAGGRVPTLTGAEILDRTPGLEAIAEPVPIDLGRTPASHFTFGRLFEIANAVRDALADPATAGAVVVQGTDTIEETAFFFDLVLDTPKPVVVTGAMRAASDPGYDGPANLRDAVRAAAAPETAGEGVLVALGGTLHAADEATKADTSSLVAFESPTFGPLGRFEGDRLVLARRRAGRRRVRTDRAAERVHLITAVVGMDGTLVEAARRAGADGFVVAATGAGNTSALLLEACRAAIEEGIPVVLVSRAYRGRVGAGYAFPGGSATWLRAGAIPGGSLSGPKARVALALGIGAGLDRAGLTALLADPGDSAG